MLSKVVSKGLDLILAILLSFMSILVFGNVIMRYVFNSGIIWSEEISRYLFVWLVFLGAALAVKEGKHLGVDIVTNVLPEKMKKTLYVLCSLIILYLLYLLFEGSYKMTILSLNSTAPVSGLPMSYVYGSGMLMSLLMFIFTIKNMFKYLKKEDHLQ